MIHVRRPQACPPICLESAAEVDLLRGISWRLGGDGRGLARDIVGFTGLRWRDKVRPDGAAGQARHHQNGHETSPKKCRTGEKSKPIHDLTCTISAPCFDSI